MKVIIGTHHKAGTNFFVNFLRDLSHSYKEIKVWDRGSTPDAQEEPNHWDIYFDHWSKWRVDIDAINFRGIHSIRDPRSLIYSATLYHLKGKEEWLHKPNAKFSGKSYFEILQSFTTIEDQLEFEMSNTSYNVIKDMYNLFDDQRFFHIKLEDIAFEKEMVSLKGCFEFCNIEQKDIGMWLRIASNHCLWKMDKLPTHSTTGMCEGWKNVFTGRLLHNYNKLFNYVEKKLGYTN